MTLPRPIPLLLAALGAVVLLSAAVGVVLTFTQSPPAWFFFSFELVVMLASVFLVLLGLGKVKDGPAITLLCCAGAIGAGSLLGWKGTGQQIDGHSITWLVAFRALIAAALVLIAAAEVAARDPKRTLPRLAWGTVMALPLLAILALYMNGVIPNAVGKLGQDRPALAFGVWMIIGIAVMALVSAAGHLFITGFAIGVAAWDRPPTPAAPDRQASAAPQPSTPSGTPG